MNPSRCKSTKKTFVSLQIKALHTHRYFFPCNVIIWLNLNFSLHIMMESFGCSNQRSPLEATLAQRVTTAACYRPAAALQTWGCINTNSIFSRISWRIEHHWMAWKLNGFSHFKEKITQKRLLSINRRS